MEDICDIYWKCFLYNCLIGFEECDRDEYLDEKDLEMFKIIMSLCREKDFEWFIWIYMFYVLEFDFEFLWLSFIFVEVCFFEFFNFVDKIQVIVKFFNIYLFLENLSYEGGVWYIDGLFNEYICVMVLYYYDSDNVIDSNMEFWIKGNKQIF